MHVYTRGAVTPTGAANEDCLASLLRMIEGEIIPRLLLAHGQALNDATAPCESAMTAQEQVATLADLALHRDAAAARQFVHARLQSGMTVERLFLELLGPTARRLGEMWEADLCDFTQVTVGLWRLQQVVHEHSPTFQSESPAQSSGRRALILAAPGSQHTFGLLIVGEFFRRGGWLVDGDPTMSIGAALALAGAAHFDLIGMSVGSECHVGAVSSAILGLRQASLNPDVVVMVGGPLAGLHPGLADAVGADGTAPDAASALLLADQLLAQRAQPGIR